MEYQIHRIDNLTSSLHYQGLYRSFIFLLHKIAFDLSFRANQSWKFEIRGCSLIPPTTALKNRPGLAARVAFIDRGISIRSWAKTQGYSERLVYYVLASPKAPTRGKSREIALALGIVPSGAHK